MRVQFGIFCFRGHRYGPTKAEARIVVAYADTTKNGPSTEADTSRTKQFLRVRMVRLLTLWSRKARSGSVNLRSTLAVGAYISGVGGYPTSNLGIEPARRTNLIGSHARVLGRSVATDGSRLISHPPRCPRRRAT